MKKIFFTTLSLFAFAACWGQSSAPLKISLGADTLANVPAVQSPPSLEIYDVTFTDLEHQGIIAADEKANITFKIKNTGYGDAYNLRLYTSEKNGVEGVMFDKHKFITKQLKSYGEITASISIAGQKNIKEGNLLFELVLADGNGYKSIPVTASLQTQEYSMPKMVIASSEIRPINNNEMRLTVTIQNTGTSTAKDVKVTVEHPNTVFVKGNNSKTLAAISPDEYMDLEFTFAKSKNYDDTRRNIYGINVEDGRRLFALHQNVSQGAEGTGTATSMGASSVGVLSDVDLNVPRNTLYGKENTYVLVIGNEKYTRNQDVPFAIKDSRVFTEYCIKTFGIPRKNITHIENATFNQMTDGVKWIARQARYAQGAAELIIYYSGHGVVAKDKTSESEEEFDQYLIPVDASGANASQSVSRKDIYASLNDVSFKRASIFLDACNSKGDRALVKQAKYDWKGDVVVFSSSSFNQVSGPYNEKGHGLFTYFLLKNFQESNGRINYKDLADRLSRNVERFSDELSDKKQTPEVDSSPSAKAAWERWKIND